MIHSSAYVSPLAVIGSPAEHRDTRRAYIGLEQDLAREHFPEIGADTIVEALVTVDSGTYRSTSIRPGCWLMKRVHVGHDSAVGDNTVIAVGAALAGSVVVGADVTIGMNASIRPFTYIGSGARIGQGAVVVSHVGPMEVWAGNPAKLLYGLCVECGKRADAVDATFTRHILDTEPIPPEWTERLDSKHLPLPRRRGWLCPDHL